MIVRGLLFWLTSQYLDGPTKISTLKAGLKVEVVHSHVLLAHTLLIQVAKRPEGIS